MSQPGNTWGDPTFSDDATLIDAKLSSNGINQIKTKLQDQLQNQYLDYLKAELQLVLISPLTRCLQTYEYGVRPVLLSIQQQEQYQKAKNSQQHDEGNPATDELSSSSKVTTLALPLMTERVYTASDTGRPVSTLSNEFPFVDFSECSTSVGNQTNPKNEESQQEANDASSPTHTAASPWWYSSTYSESEEWRPYGQGQWYAVPGEPEDVFEQRMKRFDNWLRNREETNIILVAHWGVFHHLTVGVEWNNGEAKMLEWTYDTATGKSSISLQA